MPFETDNEVVSRTLEPQAKAGHCFRQLEPSIIFLAVIRVLWLKEIKRRLWRQLLEGSIPD
jgi:hypothetical protein